jgi:hypothetical protein
MLRSFLVLCWREPDGVRPEPDSEEMKPWQDPVSHRVSERSRKTNQPYYGACSSEPG